jgi:hypothetical protein
MGSYYDIDAILTDAQKIPCTFQLDVPGLGYIGGNAGGDVWFPSAPDGGLVSSPPPHPSMWRPALFFYFYFYFYFFIFFARALDKPG